jgi:hypothetical protein
MQSIGVFDSGVGGLTVAKELINQLLAKISFISGTRPAFRTGSNPAKRS